MGPLGLEAQAYAMTMAEVFWLHWSGAFVITLAVEISLCLQLLRDLSWQRVLTASALCSCLTHPVLWWAYLNFEGEYWTFVGMGEASVVLIETGVLYALLPLTRTQALGMSLAMNSASFLVGLMVL
jgi:hypothetical protein